MRLSRWEYRLPPFSAYYSVIDDRVLFLFVCLLFCCSSCAAPLVEGPRHNADNAQQNNRLFCLQFRRGARAKEHKHTKRTYSCLQLTSCLWLKFLEMRRQSSTDFYSTKFRAAQSRQRTQSKDLRTPCRVMARRNAATHRKGGPRLVGFSCVEWVWAVGVRCVLVGMLLTQQGAASTQRFDFPSKMLNVSKFFGYRDLVFFSSVPPWWVAPWDLLPYNVLTPPEKCHTFKRTKLTY